MREHDDYALVRQLARSLIASPETPSQFTPWDATRVGALILQLLEERETQLAVREASRTRNIRYPAYRL